MFELTVRSIDGNCRNVTAGPEMTVATFRAEPSRKLTGARVRKEPSVPIVRTGFGTLLI